MTPPNWGSLLGGTPGTHMAVVSLSTKLYTGQHNDLLFLPVGISNDIILAAANQIVSLGLQDAGYEYVNIDVGLDPALQLPCVHILMPYVLRIAGRICRETRPLSASFQTPQSFRTELMV